MPQRQLDWSNLGFEYIRTDACLRADFTNGKWGELAACADPMFSIHAAAVCLHYGQACFEGLKAFRRKDGSAALFRPHENAKRMADTARRVMMEPPPLELFIDAVKKTVALNMDWVPPYGTGASFYVRPLLIGTSPRVGVGPASEYSLFSLGMPVGPYYKNGFFPVKACIQELYDRAAPLGVGNVKVAGNYAAGMYGDFEGKHKGYPICLYLDSACHRYIDEFGTSNFFGITKDDRYVTPDSGSILPSITNRSLQTIAESMGLKVERRKIDIEELPDFKEIGACGTAAVITPVYSVTRGDKVYTFGKENEAGETLTRLFKEIQGIQYGELEDKYGWMLPVGKD
ncbi:MAG: branched-chain amino acid aminotransferase [Chitinispirillales bacterium]|jgi:branched-chain amino acid aminotransferase|nr:branched-chain amino acid aminotransferase [Chitinispirillales bacterium]